MENIEKAIQAYNRVNEICIIHSNTVDMFEKKQISFDRVNRFGRLIDANITRLHRNIENWIGEDIETVSEYLKRLAES